MRSISAEGLAKIAATHGTEPVLIVEIDWAAGDTRAYADRIVGTIPGTILDVSGLDSVTNVSDSSGSQEVTITISDADGSIKALLESYDVHMRPARIYQYYMGLDLSDRFLLLSGRVNSPIEWKAATRAFTFTICSQLETEEVGFSGESGDFPHIPAELIGQSWPMIFGTVQDIPAVRVNEAISGYTLTGVGIISGLDLWQQLSDGADDSAYILSLLIKLAEKTHLETVRDLWANLGTDEGAAKVVELEMQIDSITYQVNTSASDRAKQILCTNARRSQQIAAASEDGLGENPIQILGGEDFPRGTITIRINDGLFKGYFDGAAFHILERWHDLNDDIAAEKYAQKTTDPPECADTVVREQTYHFVSQVPPGTGGQWPNTSDSTYISAGSVYITAPPGTSVESDTSAVAQQFWAEAGAAVSLESGGGGTVTYLCSITPGTVKSVKAYKQFTGERRLVEVPSDYYATGTADYGDIQVATVVMSQALSRVDSAWGDDIYVTFESDVGPNPVDVLEYIIEGYTDLVCDSTTFSAVRSKVAHCPFNFMLTGCKNAMTMLQELAFQVRCAIWVKGATVYLAYLPEQPTAVDTIGVSDVDSEFGIQVDLTPTEDLVTKLVAKWRTNQVASTDRVRVTNERSIVLRHNIKKYGTHEQVYDFYAYSQPDVVNKCATFWLIRKAKTWKEVRFRTYLTKLNLEPFDAVYLDFGPTYLSETPVLAVIKSAVYDSANNCIDFVCETSIPAGSLEPYPFYWPSALPAAMTWPTEDEIVAGYAGRGLKALTIAGVLDVGDTSVIEGSGAIFVGGPNVVFRAHSDYGDSHPTDVDFVPQEVYPESGAAVDYVAGTQPVLDLQVYPRRSVAPIPTGGTAGGGGLSAIDLNTTRIVDAEGNSATLSEIFSFNGGLLCLRTDALVWSSADGAHVFDFKYDEETEKYGAGTAFLQEDA